MKKAGSPSQTWGHLIEQCSREELLEALVKLPDRLLLVDALVALEVKQIGTGRAATDWASSVLPGELLSTAGFCG